MDAMIEAITIKSSFTHGELCVTYKASYEPTRHHISSRHFLLEITGLIQGERKTDLAHRWIFPVVLIDIRRENIITKAETWGPAHLKEELADAIIAHAGEILERLKRAIQAAEQAFTSSDNSN